jgi:hypothetical protein
MDVHDIVPPDGIAALLLREPVSVAQALADGLQSLVLGELMQHVALRNGILLITSKLRGPCSKQIKQKTYACT